MNQRTQYLIQILDKIGAPLLGAADTAGDDADTAQVVASLLGKVVETSISMNQALDLTASDAQDDSLRVALAALAGSLVADQYKQKGKVPEAADLTRVQAAMSAVLTFGDNFALSPDHVSRLEKLKADGGVVDAHQISIQYVDALIPVINAVGAFPFGQPEQKLIMDVSDRLVKRTAEMREVLLPRLSGDDEKLAELAILRATASIYAACHEAETQRLTGTDAEAPDSLSIDPVWQAFETRTAMLEAVVKNIMPAGDATQPSVAPIPPPAAPETPPPPAQPEPPAESPPEAPAIFGAKPAAEEPQEVAPSPPPAQPEAPAQPPTETPAAPSSDQTASGNPMSFFGAKPSGDAAEPPPSAPPATPEAPPPPVTPPAEPPPASPITPPADTSAQDGESDQGGDGNDGGGGNPMSFFGKKE